MKLIIQGEMPTLNEYVNAERRNRFLAAKIKKTETERVYWLCKEQRLSLITSRRIFVFVWYLKNKKKDPDNVAFAKKFVMDGLYSAGIIYNDTQEWVEGYIDLFAIDKENPRVEVKTMVSLPRQLKSLLKP